MTKRLHQSPTITVEAQLTLNYEEMKALDALAGYGIDAFLKVFYKEMGKAYLQPYEAGLRSVFEVIRSELPPITNRAKNAARAFALSDPIIRSREDHNEMIRGLVERAKGEAK